MGRVTDVSDMASTGPGRRSPEVSGLLVDRIRHRLVSTAGSSDDPALASIVRDEAAVLADDVVLAELRREVVAELAGAGPLEQLLELPGITDVLVNGPSEVWLDQGFGIERAEVAFPDDAAVRRLAQRLASGAGRRLDDASPFVDATLPDGTRLHAVLPPITAHPTISLRVLQRRRFTLTQLAPPGLAEFLAAVVAARLAVLVSGGTGSGKTTLLGAMLATAKPEERLVVIEDAAELEIDHPHIVRLVTRAPNVEGQGAIGLRELVRQALRMRPDRLIVGEFRGAEMAELLVALNTGHEGGAATVHANTASDVPARLVALGALAGLSRAAVISQVLGAIDVIVHLRRDGGSRRIDEIAVAQAGGTDLTVTAAWSAARGQLPGAADLSRRLRDRGVNVPELIR
jgi:pilus assembly protein CpaF